MFMVMILRFAGRVKNSIIGKYKTGSSELLVREIK